MDQKIEQKPPGSPGLKGGGERYSRKKTARKVNGKERGKFGRTKKLTELKCEG